MTLCRSAVPVALCAAILFLLSGWSSWEGGASDREPAPARAFLVASEGAEQRIEEGRRLLIGMRVGEAEKLFTQLARAPEGQVAGYHHLATASLLKVLVADERSAYEEFFRHADALQEALEHAPAGAWRSYVDAEHHLQVMMAHVKQGNFVRAALAARTAYARSEETVRQDPAFYDAYKGLGLLHLAIGSLPGTYRRVLQVLGYPGDVERGLRELRMAADRGRYGRDEAATILALTEGLLLNRPEQGVAILKEVYERTGRSPLVGFSYGFLLLKSRRAAEAERVLSEVARQDAASGYLYVNYSDHHLAEALFKRNDFAGAERFYLRYVERHEGPSLKAVSFLEIGRALEMLGRREQALRFYGQVKSDRPYDTDRAAVREARKRLADPLSPVDRTFLYASNAFGSGEYARAEALLLPVFNSRQSTPDQRAEAAYRLGRVYHVQENWPKALESYRQAAELAQDPAARWKAWSLFYGGQVYAEQGQPERAEQAYRAALAVKGKYDYHQTLEGSVKAALARRER